jgi:hypothetical protein
MSKLSPPVARLATADRRHRPAPPRTRSTRVSAAFARRRSEVGHDA